MANLITCIRILCSAALVFVLPFSAGFYSFYLTAGLSDVLDGLVARKTGTESELGSVLDTAADLLLAAVCLIRLLPALRAPVWLLMWTAAIALFKGITLAVYWKKKKRIAAAHTALNKLTGVLLFLLPLTVTAVDIRISGVTVCLAATIAAIGERKLLLHGDQGDPECPDRKG